MQINPTNIPKSNQTKHPPFPLTIYQEWALQGEAEIKWLVKELPEFVRCISVRTPFRRRRPTFWTDGKIVGFAILDDTAKRYDGRFQRRVFYLQAADLKPGCPYRRCGPLPIEGVDPRTVQPGVWGGLGEC